MNAETSLAPLAHIRVVLSRTSHPGNIGAAARAMKTMGLSRLYLVAPRHFPDPQATVMAVGATDILDNVTLCDSISAALYGTSLAVAVTARRRELASPILWARDAASEIIAAATTGEVALLFGNETSGLANEETDLCQRLVMIPANPDFKSLNLAAAVQILCYELRQSVLDPGAPPAITEAGNLAPHEEVDGLLNHLERAAIASGFLDPAQPKRLMPRMRRLFARARPEREEIAILRGMLAAFEKKVD
jgi:tRNA/rRNA methyltransferase